jgi:hypothetical protein
MSAFDGKTKIGRKVVDPITDHILPNSRSLAWKAITTPTALKGTNGTHCELVHGDQWNEWKGNHTENISRNQTLKVVGKHKETLVQSCYQNIIGPHIVQNNTVRNETRLGTFTKVYGDNWTHEHSWGDVSQMDQNYSCVTAVAGTYITMNLETHGVHAEAVGVHAELVLVHGEAKLFHAETNGIHFAGDGFSNQDKAMDATIDGINSNIEGVRNKVLMDEAHVSLLGLRTSIIEVRAMVETATSIFGTGLVAP